MIRRQKHKKIVGLILALLTVCTLAGCAWNDRNADEPVAVIASTAETEQASPVVIQPSVEADTMGEALWNTFQTTVSENPDIEIASLANTLAADPSLPFTGTVSSIEADAEYFVGFGDYRITGFDSASVYAPMIGSYAFVGYVFELSEDTSVNEFLVSLTSHCDPRWNICVEAEQTVAGAVGNTVFFVMCPRAVK